MPKRGKRAPPKKNPAQKKEERESHQQLKAARIEESARGYRWEQHGSGITHHCGECATPLTNPCARAKCFGRHMVVCENFHNTMFRIGGENRCDSCQNYREAQHERYSEIASLVKEIEFLDRPSVLEEVDRNEASGTLPKSPVKRMRRRSRKRLRASARAAEIARESPNRATAEDIKRVAKVMQEVPSATRLPQLDGAEDEDSDDEVQPSPSPIKTPVRRNIGNGRRYSVAAPCTSDESLQVIVDSLGVRMEVKGAARGRKEALKQLLEVVKENLVWAQAERGEFEMRRKGFFKFAGRTAYNRIMKIVVANREWRAGGEAEDGVRKRDGEEVAGEGIGDGVNKEGAAGEGLLGEILEQHWTS